MFQPGRVVPDYAVKIVAAPSGLGWMTATLLTRQSSTNATSKVQTQVQPQLLVLFQEPLDAVLIHANQRTLIFLVMILVLCWMFLAGRNVLDYAVIIVIASSGPGLMTVIL